MNEKLIFHQLFTLSHTTFPKKTYICHKTSSVNLFMRNALLLFLCITSLLNVLPAQSCGYMSWDAEDGLGSGGPYIAFFQDSKGYLWCGSYSGGVNRFDGRKWINISATTDGLFKNIVDRIFEDREGGMWFGHSDHGISRLYKGHWQHFDYSKDFLSAIVSSVYDKKKGVISLFCNRVNGEIVENKYPLYRYDYPSQSFVFDKDIVLPDVTGRKTKYARYYLANRNGMALVEDWDGKTSQYYALTGDSIRNITPEKSVTNYLLSNEFYEAYLPPAALGDLFARGSDTWRVFKGNQSVSIPTPAIPSYIPLAKRPALKCIDASYSEDGKTILMVWQILEDRGSGYRFLLADYDAETLTLRRSLVFYSDFISNAFYMHKDMAGTYWVGTPGNIIRLFPDQFRIPANSSNMPSQVWSAAQAGDGSIWFASYGEGLVNFDGLYLRDQPGGLKPIELYDDGAVTDKAGNMYFNIDGGGSSHLVGLLRFDGKDKWQTLSPGIIGFILNQDKKGRLMRGTRDRGLWILPEGQTGADTINWIKIDQSKGLQLSNVLACLQDTFGRYWMGRHSQGIAMYDPAKDTVLNWVKSDNNLNCGAMSMAEDSRGNLWFGTDKGLYFFRNRKDIGKGFELLPHLERIALEYTGDSQVTACKLYNEHTLVIGNKKGFFLLDLDAFYGQPRKVLLRPFNHSNGYDFGRVEQNGIYFEKNGDIWVLGTKGAFRYTPCMSPVDTSRPEVQIDSILAGAITYHTFDGCLKLGNDQPQITVWISSPINRMLFDDVLYRYRIDNDSIWSELNSETVIKLYPLPSGNHLLEIEALRDGIASEPLLLPFSIAPVWYKNPLIWAPFLGFCLLIGIYSYRREQKLNQQQLAIANERADHETVQKEKIQLQVQAIANQLNPHFINNALQWLQVRMQDDTDAVKVVGKLSENIRTVFRNSRDKKPYHSVKMEMLLVENYLFIQKQRFKERLYYELPDPDIIKELEDVNIPMLMIQIHVENAVEHGIRNKKDENGSVCVNMRGDDDYIIVTVKDDGVGRAAAKLIGSKGTQNGTKMLNELEHIYNAQNELKISQSYEDDIYVDTEGNKYGTRTIVRVPRNFNYDL